MPIDEKKIQEAMKHPDKLGAGAIKRKGLSKAENIVAVMREFKRGTLYSGSGHKAKTEDEAMAIAMSEAKKRK